MKESSGKAYEWLSNVRISSTVVMITTRPFNSVKIKSEVKIIIITIMIMEKVKEVLPVLTY